MMIESNYITQILLVLIGFFLTRLIKQVDESSKSVKELSAAVGELGITIKHIQDERFRDSEQIRATLKEHHQEIEMLRTRTHDTIGYVTAMRLQGEIKNGWSFNGPKWDLASIVSEKENS